MLVRVLLPLMLASISCATSTQLGDRTPSGVTLLNPAIRYSAVHPDNVVVILNETQLEGVEYDFIALIEETSHGGLFVLKPKASQAQMIESLRRKAARIGANAILLPQFDVHGVNAFSTRKGKTTALRIHTAP